MEMHKVILKSIAFTLPVLMFASCGGNDEPETPEIRLSSPEVINCVINGGSASTLSSGGYTIITHEGSKTADLQLKGFSMSSSSAPRDYIISSLPIVVNGSGSEKTYTVNTSSATSDDGTLSVSSLNIKYQTGIADGDKSADRMTLNFRSGSSLITMVPTEISATGTTVTTNITSSSAHTSTKMVYRITLTPGSTKADLYVANADFMAGMPALGEMRFGDADVEFREGGLSISSASLIPSIDGVPSPNRPVTNLSAVVDLSGPVTVGFNCMGIFRVQADLQGNLFQSE